MRLNKILVTGLSLLLSLFCCQVSQANEVEPAYLQATRSGKVQQREGVHAVIISDKVATLSSQISGYIERLYIKEGSQFKQGDTLLEFNCVTYQADQNKARAKKKLAKQQLVSKQRLHKLDAASQVELAEAEAKYEQSQAELLIKDYLASQCVIKAPFNGQVIKLMVNQHETVPRNQALFKLLDNQDLYVNIIVPSAWISKLRQHNKFKFKVKETGENYNGHVIRTVNHIDAVSRSMKVIGVIDDKTEKLHTGMSGLVLFKGIDYDRKQ